MQTQGLARPGDSQLALPRQLDRGVYTLRVLATTADGRTATHTLRVLGRPYISIRYAKRLLDREFGNHRVTEAGDGTLRLSRCRHLGPRRVRCRAAIRYGPGERFRELEEIALRADGVLQYRGRRLGKRTWWASAITP